MTAGAFSAASREDHWSEIAEREFDLLVIGGGITGVGIARDAACRGLRVALLEAGDIASGTSSVSSRLIHGGLRYLESYDFRLVFEALRERRHLLRQAPHLVKPLSFLFPVFRGDPTGLPKLAAGMWLYEGLSLFRSPGRQRLLGRRGVLEVEPALRAEDLVGGAVYYDAQVDDARLTLAIARAADEAGAVLVTRARVIELAPGRGGSAGEALVEDVLHGRRARVMGKLIVNATGPWSDTIRRLADPSVRQRLRTTKGVHILLRRDRLGNRQAVIFRSKVDGRVMFVLPWGEFTYVGTTDTEYADDPADARADEADVRYLIESAAGIFPGSSLREDDVISTWAGVRPLLAPDRAVTTSATSREHEIWRDASGLLNVAGGKLTTFRSMAAEVAERAARILEEEHGVQSGSCYTEYLPLPGAPERRAGGVEAPENPAARGIAPEVLQRLGDRYGSDIDEVLGLIESDERLTERIIPSLPYLRAEAVFAVRRELALTLDDVLRRRLHLCHELPDGGLSVARYVAELIAPEPGLAWNEQDIQREVAAYAEVVRRTRPPARAELPARPLASS